MQNLVTPSGQLCWWQVYTPQGVERNLLRGKFHWPWEHLFFSLGLKLWSWLENSPANPMLATRTLAARGLPPRLLIFKWGAVNITNGSSLTLKGRLKQKGPPLSQFSLSVRDLDISTLTKLLPFSSWGTDILKAKGSALIWNSNRGGNPIYNFMRSWETASCFTNIPCPHSHHNRGFLPCMFDFFF